METHVGAAIRCGGWASVTFPLPPPRSPVMSDRYNNTLVHASLTAGLDTAAASLGSSRARLTSVALWWFLHVLPPAARRRALEEYARAGGTPTVPGRPARRRRRWRGEARRAEE